MGLFLRWTFILLIFTPQSSFAFDDLESQWTLDILYHYTRIERSTLVNTDNFLSRQGGMLQFEYEQQIDIFWRWYIGGDVAAAVYEAAAQTRVDPEFQWPWQLYVGTGFQLGALKTFEIFFGAGGSSEHFFISTNTNQYNFYQKMSARAHLGFSWRFLSIIGSSATLLFKYSTPITTVNHNGEPLAYAGVLDGTLRLRGRYDSSWSLYGGVRFEDYKTSNRSVTYFTSRIFAGLGFHF